MTELYHWFDLIGVAVFAVSGTLIAYDKKMDGFGVFVLATVTALIYGSQQFQYSRMIVFGTIGVSFAAEIVLGYLLFTGKKPMY